MEDKKQTIGEALGTTIAAAILGLLFFANSQSAPEPLAFLDIALGAIFIMTALYKAIFT